MHYLRSLASVASPGPTNPNVERDGLQTHHPAVHEDPLGAFQPDAIAAWAILLVVSFAFWAGIAYVLWLFA
jgi:hypothetical protein